MRAGDLRPWWAVAALALSGCAAAPPAAPAYPPELMQDCLVGSKLGLSTNAELSDTVAKLAHTLKLCNIDKRKLREWANA